LVSSLEIIEKRFTSKASPGIAEIPKSYSVGCRDSSYVITGPNTIHLYTFGLTPHFASELSGILVARSEGNKNREDCPGYNGSKAIFLQPEFMKPIHSQRCIVVADAYYEYSGKNQSYLVYLQNRNRPFGIAGIYDTWKNPATGEIIDSFAIITTTANTMLQNVGVKRMPVILPWQYETNWLKSTLHLSEVLRYLVPYPSDKMNAYPVSSMTDAEGMNEPSLIVPTGERLQEEEKPVVTTGRYHYHKTRPVSNTPRFKSEE